MKTVKIFFGLILLFVGFSAVVSYVRTGTGFGEALPILLVFLMSFLLLKSAFKKGRA